MENERAIPAEAPLSFREATNLFATKSDIARIEATLRSMDEKLGAIVPREEHALRDQVWRDNFSRMETTIKDFMNDHESRVRSLERSQLPQWAITIASPIVSGLILYFSLHPPH